MRTSPPRRRRFISGRARPTLNPDWAALAPLFAQITKLFGFRPILGIRGAAPRRSYPDKNAECWHIGLYRPAVPAGRHVARGGARQARDTWSMTRDSGVGAQLGGTGPGQ